MFTGSIRGEQRGQGDAIEAATAGWQAIYQSGADGPDTTPNAVIRAPTIATVRVARALLVIRAVNHRSSARLRLRRRLVVSSTSAP